MSSVLLSKFFSQYFEPKNGAAAELSEKTLAQAAFKNIPMKTHCRGRFRVGAG
jgi:hypothetical protein